MNQAIQISLLSTFLSSIALWIGFQQHKLAKEKFKLDLFDKRFLVYDATDRFIALFRNSISSFDKEHPQFYGNTKHAAFIFGPKIPEYLKTIREKACKVKEAEAELEGIPVGEKRNSLLETKFDRLRKFDEKADLLEEKFSPYLKLKN